MSNNYGDDEVIVIKERRGSRINKGEADLVCRAKDKGPRRSAASGVSYTLWPCREWDSQKDSEDRDNAKTQVKWRVGVKKAKDNNLTALVQTHAAVPPPTSNVNNLNNAYSTGDERARFNINDFRCNDDNGITTFPTNLVDALNRFYTDTRRMPRCARNGGRKMAVGKPGQLVLWCAAGADEELKTGQFKLVGTRYNFFVIQGPSLADGRPILLGEVCQGHAHDHRRPDGTVWARRNYHVWTPERDSHKDNLDCRKAGLFKLLSKESKWGMIDSPSLSDTNEADQPSEDLARMYLGEDNELQPSRSRGECRKRRRESSSTEETTFSDDYRSERKRSKADEELLLRRWSLEAEIAHRPRMVASVARPTKATIRTIDESLAPTQHRYIMPPIATSQSSSRRASTAIDQASKQPVEFFFAFAHTLAGPILRQKPVRICPDVETLFAHAMEAGIANTKTLTLCLYRLSPSQPVSIVKGDDEEYQKFVEKLLNVPGFEQILVIPKIYG